MAGFGKGRIHRRGPGIYDHRDYVCMVFEYGRANAVATCAAQC